LTCNSFAKFQCQCEEISALALFGRRRDWVLAFTSISIA